MLNILYKRYRFPQIMAKTERTYLGKNQPIHAQLGIEGKVLDLFNMPGLENRQKLKPETVFGLVLNVPQVYRSTGNIPEALGIPGISYEEVMVIRDSINRVFNEDPTFGAYFHHISEELRAARSSSSMKRKTAYDVVPLGTTAPSDEMLTYESFRQANVNSSYRRSAEMGPQFATTNGIREVGQGKGPFNRRMKQRAAAETLKEN